MRRRAMMQLAAERQERERQAGVNTVSGWVEIIDSNINKYNNDRSLEAYINTSDDIQSNQAIVLSSPVGLVIKSGMLHINMYGLWVFCCGVAANTKYQLVVSFRHVERKAKVYVNGAYINEVERANVAPAYYNHYAIGNDISSYNLNNNFRGRINFCRLFNYALSAPEVAALYNAGRPEERVLPGYMKASSEVSIGSFVSSSYVSVAAIDGGYRFTAVGVQDANPDRPAISASFVHSDPNNQEGYYRVRFEARKIAGGDSSLGVYCMGGVHKTVTLSEEWQQVDYMTLNSLAVNHQWIYFYLYGLDKVVEVRNIRIEKVGCIAEYLPQNVVPTRKDSGDLRLSGQSSYTWTGVDSPYSTTFPLSRPLVAGCAYKITVTVSDYQAGMPFILLGASAAGNKALPIPAENGTHTIVGIMLVRPLGGVVVYGGLNAADRRLTLTVNSITSVDAAAAWLDSARQLPLNDAYLPPLLQSAGGYDLVAIGAPEILYK